MKDKSKDKDKPKEKAKADDSPGEADRPGKKSGRRDAEKIPPDRRDSKPAKAKPVPPPGQKK